MANFTSYQTKTIQNGNVKADTIKKVNLEDYQPKKEIKFQNVVSNQKDVTIDLSQFLNEPKSDNSNTQSNNIETLYDDNNNLN